MRASRRSCLAVAVAVLAATVVAGCGLDTHTAGGTGVTITVTRDFGARPVTVIFEPKPPNTALGALQRAFPASLAANHRIDSIDGLSADGSSAKWFGYVNGIGFSTPPATMSVHAGDRLWWDLHDASPSGWVPAVVGAFPEPFVHGVGGRRFPTTLECASDATAACNRVAQTLTSAGIPSATQELGTGSGEDTIAVVVGTWSELRPEIVASLIDGGPTASGVYARFAGPVGQSLELLDAGDQVVRTLTGAAGLIAATRDTGSAAPTWLITGTDLAGVQAAADALTPSQMRNRFALAVAGGDELSVPQPPSGSTR